MRFKLAVLFFLCFACNSSPKDSLQARSVDVTAGNSHQTLLAGVKLSAFPERATVQEVADSGDTKNVVAEWVGNFELNIFNAQGTQVLHMEVFPAGRYPRYVQVPEPQMRVAGFPCWKSEDDSVAWAKGTRLVVFDSLVGDPMTGYAVVTEVRSDWAHWYENKAQFTVMQ